jgi:hypothetical protein
MRRRFRTWSMFWGWWPPVSVVVVYVSLSAICGVLAAIFALAAGIAGDRETAEAKAEAANANERAAILEVEAGKLRIELAKRLQRVILPDAQEELALSLKNAPKGPVLLIARDTEQATFGGDIEKVLRQAGFSNVSMSSLGDAHPAIIPKGLHLWIKDKANPAPQAEKILSAFSGFGMTETENFAIVPDLATVIIAIGPRP